MKSEEYQNFIRGVAYRFVRGRVEQVTFYNLTGSCVAMLLIFDSIS